jgi:glycerol dehydrogenase
MATNYTLDLPHYSVGPQAYDLIGDVIRPYGHKVAVIGGETALKKAKEPLLAALKKAGATVTDLCVYCHDSTMDNVNKIMERPGVKEADILFGVGGGRACDTVKCAADMMGKTVMTCPTVASNCAPVSALAVIYNNDGSLNHYHVMKSCAAHCFINTTVILDSPERLFWAGIGDALSKQLEVLYATKNRDLFHTPLLGATLALACQEPLLKYGAKALDDFKNNRMSDDFKEVVLDIIVSTGIVSNLTSSKEYYYNSALAHCFYNAATVIPATHKHLHGEIVSFGNLVQCAYDEQFELLDRLLKFNMKVGLPVTLAQVDVKVSDLDKLLDKAPSVNEWKTGYRETTREGFRAAILKADELGRKALAEAAAA